MLSAEWPQRGARRGGKGQALLDAVLRRSPAQAFFRRRAAQQLLVLAYHGVGDPRGFARQLDYLRETRAFVSLDGLLGALAGREPLPERPALVTFDDADPSVLEHGLPALRERGIAAVAFVVAGLLDSDRPFWWREVEHLVEWGGTVDGRPVDDGYELVRKLKRCPDEQRLAAIDALRLSASAPSLRTPHLRASDLPVLEAQGIAVGSHSLSHPSLSWCDWQKTEAEVEGSRRILGQALGRAPRAFAYPDGDVDERVRTSVARAGYDAAFLFDHRVSSKVPCDPLAISRVRVNSRATLDRFASIVSGLHPAVHRVRGGQ